MFSPDLNPKEPNMPNIQQPPRAKKVEHITEMHCHRLIDNYYWLKDQSISNPEVLAQISAENSYSEAVLTKSKPLQEKIYREMLHRNNKNTESGKLETEIHYTQIGNWFYWNAEKNKDDRFYTRYRKRAEPGTEEEILDLNEVAKKYEYFVVDQIQYTPDRNYILVDCIVDNPLAEKGKEMLILIYDVNAKIFIESLKSCEAIMVVEQNSIIYNSTDDNGKFKYCGVRKHKIGTDPKDDEILYHENSEYRTYANQSESGHYLVLSTHNYYNDEYWLLNLKEPDSKFKCFSPKTENELYLVNHSGDYFYILTNLDGANNFKLMRTTLDKTDKQFWQEIVPHSETVCLDLSTSELIDVSVFKNYFVWREIENGLARIKYINNTTNEIKEIKFEIDVPFYDVSCNGGDYEGDKFSFSVSSLGRKSVEYEYDFITGELKQVDEDIVNDYQPDLYQSEIIFATAKDGVKIPIHLFYRKDLFKRDSTNPLFIEGYSAYGCLDDGFISNRLSLIDRGFVYAYAQMRGCAYYGYKWYRAGVRENKSNRYEDFIACTEYLIENNYCDRNKVAAYGISAGGQIMGYIANNRPDLYKCIISRIPTVDTLNCLINHDNHNSESEVIENGNINNKSDFEYILSHDPYNNIKKQAYPNIISIASLYDFQVGYWEPIKWINKIRDYKTDNNQQFVLMLKEGHGGGRSTPDWYSRTLSTAYAYVCDLFGIDA